MNLAPWVWYLLLILLVGCQMPQNPTVRRPAVETLAATRVLEQVDEPLSEQPVFSALEKPAPRGSVAMQGNTLTMSLQLPPLPEKMFQTQFLDLGTASKILATVTDSHGKTYTPVGADGNGRLNYPANGVVELTFNNVLPDALLLAELKVLDTGLADIPQADVAVALRHTGVTNPAAVTINFQTGAVAKTLKALLALNAARARTVDLAQLNTLMASITGQGGTAPNFTYAQVHPTLVKIPELATALVANNPNTLTATTYRANGATINLNVSGLTGTDRLQVQITDAASVVKTNLSNGNNQLLTKVTPSTGLKVNVSAFGTPAVTYSYTATPSNLPALIEGGTQNVTITATPNISLTSFAPAFGPPGTAVVINGTGFTGTTAVTFNGAPASFTVNSSTQITATVPANATDGLIAVTNGSTVTSVSNFNVYRQIYVRSNASGSNNGTSWANAYTSLKTALTVAVANDDVWVAAGTYKPDISNVNIVFNIPEGVDVYGGFLGSENNLADRNVGTNVTILSGDLNNDDNTTLTPFTTATPNSNVLVQLASNSALDGFTIQGARTSAILMNSVTSVQLRNLIVRHNVASSGGGGLRAQTAEFQMDNVRFTNNSGSTYGGGVYLLQSVATINNATFQNNQAADGASISIGANSNLSFTNSLIENNQATSTSAGLYVYSGAVGGNNGNISVQNVVFKNNSGGNGTALFVDSMKGQLTLNRVAFYGNSGGELMRLNVYSGVSLPAHVSFSNVLIANNTIAYYTHLFIVGGQSSNASVAFRNMTLANNSCTTEVDQRCQISNQSQMAEVSTYQNLLFWKDKIGESPAISGGNIDLGISGTPFLNSVDPDGTNNIMFNSDDGYTLRSTTTAAINTGVNNADVPSQDITARNRVGNVDAGAYEYIP